MNLELPTLRQPNGYRQDIDAAMMRLNEIRSMVMLALPDDVSAPIMRRLHAEKRYGDVEQAWIDEAVSSYPDRKGPHGYSVRDLVGMFEAEKQRIVEQFGLV